METFMERRFYKWFFFDTRRNAQRNLVSIKETSLNRSSFQFFISPFDEISIRSYDFKD